MSNFEISLYNMRIAINGFGRIGRNFLREFFKRNSNIEIVAINDLANINTLAHLLKYDSLHGVIDYELKINEQHLIINGSKIEILQEKDPENLPWQRLEIDVVVESTGFFRTEELAGKHLIAGAKQVVLSAPALSDNIATVVMGINDHKISFNSEIISNASCTTNNVAPMFKILNDNWGIESAYITTVHSYTTDQKLHDAPHKDLRRARSAPNSIVPTTTGAAKAITKIFPELKGNVGGCGIRVPVPNGSMTDVNCILKTTPSVEEINTAFKQAANNNLQQILYFQDEPIVSIDINNNPYSCVFDSLLTSVVGNMVKVVGWYDNEIGYSNRLIDLICRIQKEK